MPPISLDPLAEQVEKNSQDLSVLASSINSLEKKSSTCLMSTRSPAESSSVPQSGNATYAHKTASFLPPANLATISNSFSGPYMPTVKSEEHEPNLILVGLPVCCHFKI